MLTPIDLEAKLTLDTKIRLDENGLPRNQFNDYERHLYARKLHLDGLTESEVREKLLQLNLSDIPFRAKEKYITDILNSLIVGFPNKEGKLLPVYEQIGE